MQGTATGYWSLITVVSVPVWTDSVPNIKSTFNMTFAPMGKAMFLMPPIQLAE